MNSYVPLIFHTVVVLALVGGYVATVLSGQDGTALVGVLGGYIAGAGAQTAVHQANGGK